VCVCVCEREREREEGKERETQRQQSWQSRARARMFKHDPTGAGISAHCISIRCHVLLKATKRFMLSRLGCCTCRGLMIVESRASFILFKSRDGLSSTDKRNGEKPPGGGSRRGVDGGTADFWCPVPI
jgi:hypothetical protein